MTGSPGVSAEAARLDADLRRLHGTPGAASCLAALYARAATLAEDDATRRFRLTHAWVHALSAGDWAAAARFEDRLRALGGL